MIFEISRARSDSSCFDENDKPCKDAYLFEETDVKYYSDKSEGKNIKRIMTMKKWFIEITTLEQLKNIQKECGYPIGIDFEERKILICDPK